MFKGKVKKANPNEVIVNAAYLFDDCEMNSYISLLIRSCEAFNSRVSKDYPLPYLPYSMDDVEALTSEYTAKYIGDIDKIRKVLGEVYVEDANKKIEAAKSYYISVCTLLITNGLVDRAKQFIVYDPNSYSIRLISGIETNIELIKMFTETAETPQEAVLLNRLVALDELMKIMYDEYNTRIEMPQHAKDLCNPNGVNFLSVLHRYRMTK